jgi:ankyrin repeat protein
VKAKAVDDMTALHFAAQNGHTEIARMLITAGLPVNSKTRKRVTALHLACHKGAVLAAMARQISPLTHI